MFAASNLQKVRQIGGFALTLMDHINMTQSA
jgi:hypothetical protein